jgi:hypothetical protein
MRENLRVPGSLWSAQFCSMVADSRPLGTNQAQATLANPGGWGGQDFSCELIYRGNPTRLSPREQPGQSAAGN